MSELRNEGREGSRKSFAIILRGHPDDFQFLIDHAKAVGLYVVFTKTSSEKLVVQEVPF
jgi:hypothetical protein